MRHLLILLTLLGSGVMTAKADPPPSPADALRGVDPTGYARAMEKRDFRFPEDHGAHPDFQLEWWYFVAHLEADDGRRFGVQWTVFRRALAPSMEARDSSWATRQIYFGHFALSDVDGGRFHAFERHSRGGAGLAGAEARPRFQIWLDDWSIISRGEEFFPLRLRARESEIGVDLEVHEGKPLVLQGDGGLSRKGTEPGAASYYYSLTRLPLVGTVEVDGERLAVTGSGWIDREWMTNSLGEGQVGWDWFALQLDDGRDLMIGRLRREDGGIEPTSHGLFVDASGGSRTLARDDTEITVLETWQSPRGGVYPSRWLLRVPEEEIELEIVPRLADQELDLSMRYWEGAVALLQGGSEVGRGYVELVGYAR